MKKIIACLVAMATICSSIVAFANVELNGAELSMAGYTTDSGVAMMQVRYLCENLGCTVGWVGETETVTIQQNMSYTAYEDDAGVSKNHSNYLELSLGGSKIYKNNGAEVIEMPERVTSLNGSTYVPIRAIAEALDCTVSWNSETSNVVIETPLYKNGAKTVGRYFVPFNTTIETELDEELLGLSIFVSKDDSYEAAINDVAQIASQQFGPNTVNMLKDKLNALRWDTAENQWTIQFKNDISKIYIFNYDTDVEIVLI